MNTLLRLTSDAPASTLLLSTILVVSLLALYKTPGLIESNLLRPFGLAQRGEYFTLVTSGFIHADLAHLLFNCFTFWAFGFALERQIGTTQFAALYAVGLLSSSVATWFIHRRQPGYSSLGASGAILAVLFASIIVFPTSSIFVMPIPLPIGTVFNNENDWAANLRWFLPKWFLAGHPDEYSETVQTFAPAFVEEFKTKLRTGGSDWAFLKNATIYSTGHSLGGGLAQQFAYALPVDDAVQRVTHVVAFDPSPVTGYFSVEQSVRENNQKTLFIDRIYERGEILAIVRSLTSAAVMPSEAQPTIRGVRFSLFYPANPIAGHSMSELACKLYEAAGG